jgi:hypothetical protein
MQAPEHDRRGQGELAFRLTLLPGKAQLRRLELGDDAAAGVEIGTAGLGEHEVRVMRRTPT